MTVPVASPCINVCTLDPSGRLCLGCFRTIDEIAGWGSMPEADKARVVAMLSARRRSCSRCGAAFGCGAKDAGHDCWCASFPPVSPSPDRDGCLCPACLAAVASATTAHR